MNGFITSFLGEYKKHLYRVNMIAWGIILVIMLSLTNSAINSLKQNQSKIDAFKKNQITYFKIVNTYLMYQVLGFEILFVLPPTTVISNESTIPEDLSAKIDGFAKVQISNNFKGLSLSSQGKGPKPTIAIIIKLLISLFALWYGFETNPKIDFSKFLASMWSRLKSFIYTTIPRFLLFILTFLLIMGIAFLFILARGITFNAGDFSFITCFLLEAVVFIGFFFFLGILLSPFRNKRYAVLIIIIPWFLINIADYWIVKPAMDPGFPDALKDYQTVVEKWDIIKEFEAFAEKKYGKFDRKNLELGKKVIEDFWNNYYLKRIKPREEKLRDLIAAGIEKERSISKFFPGLFFNMTANEVSGCGYTNYLRFYDYLIEMHAKFVRFIIDHVYYNDPKIMVNFIKDDEDIFIGKSSLPPNYWPGVLIHLGYFVVLLIAGYFCYVAKMFPKPKNAREFDSIEIELKSGENSIINNFTYKEEFGQQLVNVFFGNCRDLKFKFTLDGKSLLTGKKHDFIYIPKPDHIPDEWKVKHLLQFFKRLFHLDPKDLESLYIKDPDLTRKEWLNKFFRELDTEKQAVLLISLYMMVKKDVYIANNFSDHIPSPVGNELHALLIEKQPSGSMILDINQMDKQWTPCNKGLQRFYYTKAKGYHLFKLGKDDERSR